MVSFQYHSLLAFKIVVKGALLTPASALSYFTASKAAHTSFVSSFVVFTQLCSGHQRALTAKHNTLFCNNRPIPIARIHISMVTPFPISTVKHLTWEKAITMYEQHICSACKSFKLAKAALTLIIPKHACTFADIPQDMIRGFLERWVAIKSLFAFKQNYSKTDFQARHLLHPMW